MTERDAHSQVWRCVTLATNPVTGAIEPVVGSYTELATGLNYVDESGQLQPTKEEFTLKSPGAVAERGPHRVTLAANIHSAGAVDVVGPDGVRFQNHPLGLAYFDAQSGRRVILAEVQDCVGELAAPNQIVYPEAFRGLNASLRYTYLKAGLACDAILHEAPLPPSAYGLSDKHTRLEMLTDLLLGDYAPSKEEHVVASETDPAIRAHMAEPDFSDATLGFGAMSLGPGRAFAVGDGGASAASFRAPVGKRLAVMGGRTILIEAVQYQAVRRMFDQPGVASASVGRELPAEIKGTRAEAASAPKTATAWASIPMAPDRAASAQTERVSVAMTPLRSKGLVLDWEYLNSANSVTLKAGTTYYVTGIVNLGYTTTIEGGTVVKYAPSANSPQIRINGTLKCVAAPYHPAVFTARDDNSVGEAVPGSGGNLLPPPGNYYGNPALYFGYYAVGPVRNIRVSYAVTGIDMCETGPAFDVWHSQFVHCATGVSGGSRTVNLRNVLLADLNCAFAGYGDLVCGQNVTLNGVALVADAESAAVFTNCVFANITSFGSVSGAYNGFTNLNQRFGDPSYWDPPAFEVVGGASHYLRSGSPFRNVGTMQIDGTLLVDLKRMTTFAPSEYTTMPDPPHAACLPQKVQRDYDLLDLGYHYDAIDWVVSALEVSQPLTLKPGVVVASHTAYGIYLRSGGSLVSVGSPVNLNRLIRYNCVQEQSTAGWALSGASYAVFPTWQTAPAPTIFARCTDFAALGATTYHLHGITAGNFAFTDCQLSAGRLSLAVLGSGSPGINLGLTNNLLERVEVYLEDCGDPLTVSARNNLFLGGALHTVAETGLAFYDNLFDRTTITQEGEVSHNYNAYRTGFSRFSPNGQNDVVYGPLLYGSGPLGRYYVNASIPTLVDAGSRLASAAKLAHYTTKTSQVQEGATQVDIGLHYAPVMGVSEIPKSSMTLSSEPVYRLEDLSLVKDDVLDHDVPWWAQLDPSPLTYPECASIPTGWLRIDLGTSRPVAAFVYRSTPRTTQEVDVGIRDYELYVTDSSVENPSTWGDPVASGTWSWSNRPVEQAAENKVVKFQPATGRYVILRCVRGADFAGGKDQAVVMGAAEVWVFKSDSASKTLVPLDANTICTDDYLEDWGEPPDLSAALGLRVDVEHDAWCTPDGNPDRQIVRPPSPVLVPPGHPGVTYAYSVDVEARVEMEYYCFDYVSLWLRDSVFEPSEPLAGPFEDRFVICQGDQCFQGCDLFASKNRTKTILLLGGSDLILEYDTADERFHIGCFAEIPDNSQAILYMRALQPLPLP